MATLLDRVQESTTTTGTGAYALSGAVTGFRSFNSQASNGTIIRCVIEDGVGGYEVGDYTLGTNTLTRTTIIESSNSNNAVNWGSGTKLIYSDATVKDVLPDQTGNSGKFLITSGTDPSWSNSVNSLTLTGGTANGVLYLNGSKDATSGSALTFDGSTLAVGSGDTGLNTNFSSTNVNGVYIRFQNNGTSIGDIGSGAQIVYAGGTAGDFGITSRSGSLIFGQNSAEQMRLTSTGLGIGTSSPAYILDVRKPSGTTIVNIGHGGVDNTGSVLLLSGASSYKNWTITNNYNIGGALEFVQTTAAGGMTIGSTSAMLLDSSGNLGIGATANASAILDAQSTTKGVRFPNMTTTQKNAISSPAAGLVVFDTTLAKLCVYSGAAWQTITSV